MPVSKLSQWLPTLSNCASLILKFFNANFHSHYSTPCSITPILTKNDIQLINQLTFRFWDLISWTFVQSVIAPPFRNLLYKPYLHFRPLRAFDFDFGVVSESLLQVFLLLRPALSNRFANFISLVNPFGIYPSNLMFPVVHFHVRRLNTFSIWRYPTKLSSESSLDFQPLRI